MRDAFRPTNVAVDSVGLFVAAIAWVFVIWIPIILLAVLFYLRNSKGSGAPTLALLLILLPCIAIFVILGFLLKWVALGIIRRKRPVIVLSVLVLTAWAFILGRSVLLPQNHSISKAFEVSLQAIALLGAGCVTALGLTKGANTLDEQPERPD
jgi:hypothetical protein